MKVALGYIFKFVANYSLQSMLSKEPSLTFFIKMSLTLTETSCGQDRLLLVGTSRAATSVTPIEAHSQGEIIEPY